MPSLRREELIRALSRAKEAADEAEIERNRDIVAAKKRKGTAEHMLLARASNLLGLEEDALIAQYGYIAADMAHTAAEGALWPDGKTLDGSELDPHLRSSTIRSKRGMLALLCDLPRYKQDRGWRGLCKARLIQDLLSSVARFRFQFERIGGRHLPPPLPTQIREAVLLHSNSTLHSAFVAAVRKRYSMVDASETEQGAIETWFELQHRA